MTKKEKAIYVIKLILELITAILLVLAIIYLVKSEKGVLAKIDEGNANEKLSTAIKIFSSTEGMKLEDAIRNIDGLEDLKINEETGGYNIKIDGQEFLVISKEILNGGEENVNSIEIKEGTSDEKQK